MIYMSRRGKKGEINKRIKAKPNINIGLIILILIIGVFFIRLGNVLKK
ncbi:hypothetical protein DFR97_005456 [Clostridium beijerinckii]|nr:hypothetical protein [Clostridium beijerinckii]